MKEAFALFYNFWNRGKIWTFSSVDKREEPNNWKNESFGPNFTQHEKLTSANKEMLKMISLLTQTFFKPWVISDHVHTVTHTGTVLQKDAVGMRWAGACV